MIGYVYKTTNKKNGKVYIGKCKCDHFRKTYYGSGVELKKDIAAYGYKRFKVKIIKRCDTLKELNESEKYYIAYYREKLGRDMCYNIAAGGNGGWGNSNSEPKSFFVKRGIKRALALVVIVILLIVILEVLIWIK